MNIHELSAIENDTIRRFVNAAADDGLLRGRILDYGCGKQPYRDICRGAGEYVPYDRREFGGNVSGKDIGGPNGDRDFDTVLATQVIQYVDYPWVWLCKIRDKYLVPGGHLVMTYPGAWPVLRDDLQHFTKLGVERLLAAASFTVVRHELRASLPFDGFEIPTGYGVIARL